MTRWPLFLAAVLFGLVTLPVQPSEPLYGIAFSPYGPGQDPTRGDTVTTLQIRERLRIVAPYFKWIRTYGSTGGLQHIAGIARQMGFKTAIGAWISQDAAANARELANLESAFRAGNVDLAIVGSEALLRNDASAAQIIAMLNEMRRRNPGMLLGYADVFERMEPAFIANFDFIIVHIHPYWDGTPLEHAVAAVAERYARVVAASPGKQVIIGETGWPSAGNRIGMATPTPDNQSRYIREFLAWASANHVPYFLFQSFDEAWKAKQEGPQGAHWGLWNQNEILKPRIEAVLLKPSRRAP